VYLSNPFSKRELGEPSLLNEIDFKPSDIIIGPYEKVNWDGRRIKSVSAVLRSHEKAIGILCINVDVSHFHAVMQTLNALVSVPQVPEKPVSLFKEDWHERINEYIQSWTRERGLSVTDMSRAQKQQLVTDLAGDGAFGGRNAAAYISRILGLGRATVYNYLRRKDHA
jgi:predicted transcriptional regulator YheO